MQPPPAPPWKGGELLPALVEIRQQLLESSLLVTGRNVGSSKLAAAEIIVVDNVKNFGPTPSYSPPFQGGVGGGWSLPLFPLFTDPDPLQI